ncbi:MAG: ribonuclease HI [Rickettsiales bacterium]|jgi:ribonuclease HI|nr:ribonuclease HI [Rickettsiales bacterium]
MLKKLKEITIYTDGSCLNNPGNGGWGAILIYNKKEKEIAGYQANTTNNQMELRAVIEGLKTLNAKCKINIYTDSKYVQQGITSWIYNWIKNDWKAANKKPVKNKELWQELYQESGKHDIAWHWVKAHNGDKYNEKVDQLANDAAHKGE